MEFIDLYDINMRKLNKVIDRDADTLPNEFAMHVHVVICTPDHRFLLQLRSRTKRVAPGVWDITGGGVQAGETSRDTAIRETMEELALDLTNAKMELGWQKTNLTPWRHHLIVWGAKTEIDLDALVFAPKEVDCAKLVSAEEYIDAVCWNKDEEYRLRLTAFCETLKAL